MTHYYCQGSCKGMIEEADLDGSPAVCRAETCELHDQPLTKCECDEPTSHQE